MILQTFVFEAGPLEVNHYAMAAEPMRRGLLVDAGVCGTDLVDWIKRENISVETILVTHLHGDHVAALADFCRHWPHAEIFSPAKLQAAPHARIVGEGETISAAGFEFTIYRTSGHTPESISYFCPAEGICFVGDAIFAGAVGGTSDDELHAEEIEHLRSKILALPEGTELLSGHGPATTVAIEKAANPFLQPGFTRLPSS